MSRDGELSNSIRCSSEVKLQERLRTYPQAAQWQWEGEQLEVARGLASNTHVVVQVGGSGNSTNDIARAFLVRTVSQDMNLQTDDGVHTESKAGKPPET